jgi:hypothetical protein
VKRFTSASKEMRQKSRRSRDSNTCPGDCDNPRHYLIA